MRSTVNTKISQFILITGLVVFFLLVMITPVSAELRTINPGATVFIGESNLDLSNAMGGSNTIGWWAPGAVSFPLNPSKTINLATRYTDFLVAPADFVGFTGNWYPLNADGTTAQTGTSGNPVAVFNVQDPNLDIAVLDFNVNLDVTGKSVLQGDHLGFQISTNMYAAVNPQYRPNVNAATDGYINIKVKDESGVTLTSLYNSGGTAIPLTNQFVNTQPYYWGNFGSEGVSSVNNWYTGALDQNGQYRYPTGTYTVYAVSLLNNMKDNYKNMGADYTGKTVSVAHTITLFSTPTPQPTTVPPLATPTRPPTMATPTPQPTTVPPLATPTRPPTMATPPPQPTTVPLPSIGSIVVTSHPAGATIFLDNAIKGITPLTINSVPNGNHVVLFRLDGYQDLKVSINVRGDTGTFVTLTPIVSLLNNMKDNYKNMGADYTGKTVSVAHTITLFSTPTPQPTPVPPLATPTRPPTMATPTPQPTPVPLPSIGSIVVTSRPAGATIFLDNAIKGITPLTINSVPNGNHVVLFRLDGYQDLEVSINVRGDTQTFVTLTPIKTVTPKPTATVNYGATIAAMQTQIAEQSAKIAEQGNILDQITNFLRKFFGWK